MNLDWSEQVMPMEALVCVCVYCTHAYCVGCCPGVQEVHAVGSRRGQLQHHSPRSLSVMQRA